MCIYFKITAVTWTLISSNLLALSELMPGRASLPVDSLLPKSVTSRDIRFRCNPALTGLPRRSITRIIRTGGGRQLVLKTLQLLQSILPCINSIVGDIEVSNPTAYSGQDHDPSNETIVVDFPSCVCSEKIAARWWVKMD